MPNYDFYKVQPCLDLGLVACPALFISWSVVSIDKYNRVTMSLPEGLFARMSDVDSQDFLIAVFFLVLSYLVCNTIYQLYFSPLSKFPGPKIAAVTLGYEIYYDVFKWGKYYLKIRKMHERYGESICT